MTSCHNAEESGLNCVQTHEFKEGVGGVGDGYGAGVGHFKTLTCARKQLSF